MARPRSDRDYYAILGVAPSASEDEIRRAFRRLALRWHPDRNPGDAGAAERFKEISEAYAVLIDPVRRRTWETAHRTGAPTDFHARRDDLFRDLFADPRASAIFDELAAELGRLGVRVERRDFHERLFGGRAVVTGRLVIVTPHNLATVLLRLARAGARGALRAHVEAPPVSARRPSLLGRLATAVGRRLLGVPPPSTARDDADIELPLQIGEEEAARGTRKRVTLTRGDRTEEVLVTVPAGIATGARLRLRGKGRPAAGGRAGDAYLIVEVTPGASPGGPP